MRFFTDLRGAARGVVARDAAGRQPGVRSAVPSVSSNRTTLRPSRAETVCCAAAADGCPAVCGDPAGDDWSPRNRSPRRLRINSTRPPSSRSPAQATQQYNAATQQAAQQYNAATQQAASQYNAATQYVASRPAAYPSPLSRRAQSYPAPTYPTAAPAPVQAMTPPAAQPSAFQQVYPNAAAPVAQQPVTQQPVTQQPIYQQPVYTARAMQNPAPEAVQNLPLTPPTEAVLPGAMMPTPAALLRSRFPCRRTAIPRPTAVTRATPPVTATAPALRPWEPRLLRRR